MGWWFLKGERKPQDTSELGALAANLESQSQVPAEPVSGYTPAEEALLASLATAADALLPGELDDPWVLRYAESAQAHREAFEAFGLKRVEHRLPRA